MDAHVSVCCILIIIFESTNGLTMEELIEKLDRCKADRKTVFAMEGSTVTYTRNVEFEALRIEFGWLNDSFVYECIEWFSDAYILQYDRHRETYTTSVLCNRSTSNIDLLIRQPDNRTVVSIELNDVMLMDDRIYYTDADKPAAPLVFHLDCFHLYVMEKLKAKPNRTLEENEQVYVYAPDIPHVNATTLWLLDGLTSDQTELFIQRDDYIWIPQVKKYLDGNNVTFRTILNETVFDNNFTLSVRNNNNILMQGILMKVIVGFASGQVLTLLVFGLCVFVVCKRFNKLSSKTSLDTAANKQYGANTTKDTVGYQLTTASSALENYDSLNTNEIYDTAT